VTGFLGRIKQEWQIENGEVLYDADQQTGIQHHQIQSPALKGGHVLKVTAELAAGEHPDLDFAAAFLLDQVGEFLCA
jgi:hypothetical protein